MEIEKQIIDCYKRVESGGSKSQYEDKNVKVTAYRVGNVIRIDVNKKGE